MIDWEDLTEGYNYRYKKDFNESGMLIDIYHRVGGSIDRAAELLGVSMPTLHYKYVELGIPRRQRFGNNGKSTKQLILDIPTHVRDGMTMREISVRIGRAYGSVASTLRSMGMRVRPDYGGRQGICPHCGKEL